MHPTYWTMEGEVSYSWRLNFFLNIVLHFENKGKKFVQVVQKSWAECRGYCAEQKAHIRDTAAHSEENWILGETNRSAGDNE